MIRIQDIYSDMIIVAIYILLSNTMRCLMRYEVNFLSEFHIFDSEKNKF